MNSLSSIEQARSAARLLQLREQLQSGSLNAMEQIRATTEALALYAALGGETATGPVPVDAEQAAEFAADDGLSDDPNAENYRYKDTGYISGSRKELAAQSIKLAREAGQMLRVSDIDFKAIEENPRQARELIKKANLFGSVDWAAQRESGMTPQAGYLVNRLYAAIAPMPAEDSPKSRRSYAIGIETLRTRMERLTTTEEVVAAAAEIGEELTGASLNSDEVEQFNALTQQRAELGDRQKAIMVGRNTLYNAMSRTTAARDQAKAELENRVKRGWKVAPMHEEAVETTTAAAAADIAAYGSEVAATKEEFAALRAQIADVEAQKTALEDAAKARHLRTPEAQAWTSMGSRFINAVMFQRLRTGTFAGQVAKAEEGEPDNWDWAEKEKPDPERQAPKKRITFTLKVVEKFERSGGRPVTVTSTADLEKLCGFRAVQSGTWVQEDFAAAKWHVEQSAGAWMDMSDVLQIEEDKLGFGGRLGMAFGARGAGGKGAAKAHYEPVERVINITKLNGAGSQGHEAFKALDNIMPSLLRGEEGAKEEFATERPELMPAGPIRAAFVQLKAALTSGSERLVETIKLTPKSRATAIVNIENSSGYVALAIKQAGALEPAVLAVDKRYEGETSPGMLKQKKLWRQLAAAYYSPVGATEATAKTGASVSRFYVEAQALDDGVAGRKWSETHEMAARAFQAYLEDKLTAMDRKNDYLSCLADNKYHYLPALGMPFKPYPEGEERARINAAFDQVFAALRDEKAFEKAMTQTALLDSIFGVMHD
jgi:hypothetical protein